MMDPRYQQLMGETPTTRSPMTTRQDWQPQPLWAPSPLPPRRPPEPSQEAEDTTPRVIIIPMWEEDPAS